MDTKFLALLSYLARDNHRLALLAFYVYRRNPKFTAEECVAKAKEMIESEKKDSHQEVEVKKKHLTRHHIIPRSRGGKSDKYNICIVDAHKHELYHALFQNMTPREIIKYLMKTFWNNNYPTSEPTKGKGAWCQLRGQKCPPFFMRVIHSYGACNF